MKITALLLNYKRPDNLKKIINSLRNQTIPVEIFLWNNNIDDVRKYDVDMQINCSKNLMCSPRWLMGGYTNSEYVFSLDDDLMFSDNSVIEDSVKYIENIECNAVGYTGVILNKEKDYWSSLHIKSGTEDKRVDIIKGRFFFTRRESLGLVNWTSEYKKENFRIEDDIILSSKLTTKMIPSIFAGRFINLPSRCALHNQEDHKESRTLTTRKYL